jgi:hypothetical protein
VKLYIVTMDYKAMPDASCYGECKQWEYYVLADSVEAAAEKVRADRKSRGTSDSGIVGVRELSKEVIT